MHAWYLNQISKVVVSQNRNFRLKKVALPFHTRLMWRSCYTASSWFWEKGVRESWIQSFDYWFLVWIKVTVESSSTYHSEARRMDFLFLWRWTTAKIWNSALLGIDCMLIHICPWGLRDGVDEDLLENNKKWWDTSLMPQTIRSWCMLYQ